MKKRIASVDFLKFLLAVLVVFHHFQQLTDVRFSYINFWGGKFYFGYAVEIFFLISGFMSAMNLNRTKEQSFIEYIKKPFVRIYPMTVINSIAMLFILLAYRFFCGRNYEGVGTGFWRIFSSLFLVFSGGAINDIDPALNQHTWYLSVLIICYILVWVICFICAKLGTSPYYVFGLMSLIGLGGIQYNIDIPFLNNSSSRGYATFFLGMVLFLVYEKVDEKIRTTVSAILTFVIIAGGVIKYEVFFDNVWAISAYILFPAVLFLTIGMDRLFKGKIWYILGQTSFELYIWHMFGLIVIQILKETGVINSYYGLAGMIIFTIVTGMFAFLVYNYVEKPITKWLREKVKNAGVVS